MSCYAWRIILHISKSYGDKREMWSTCTKSQTVLQVYQTFGTQSTLWITCHTVWEWSQSKTPVLCCDLIPVVLTAWPLWAGLQTQSYGSSALGTQSNYNHFQPTDVCDGRGNCINKVDGDKKKKEGKKGKSSVWFWSGAQLPPLYFNPVRASRIMDTPTGIHESCGIYILQPERHPFYPRGAGVGREKRWKRVRGGSGGKIKAVRVWAETGRVRRSGGCRYL